MQAERVSQHTALAVTAAAYLVLVVVYFLSFGSSAWHPTDYELTMAWTWRLAHGEVPYRDFMSHKPPGTIWFHTVWLLFPDHWQVRASRLFFYAQMAFSGALPILWALHRRRIVFGWRLPILGVTFVIFALHNFPVMPWQTTDGVMFATIGLVALLESVTTDKPRGAVAMRAGASAAFTLALLCKQSFFPLCLLLAGLASYEVLAIVIRGRTLLERWQALKLYAASALPALMLLGACYAYLRATGALEQFIRQFLSQSTGSALAQYGTPWSEYQWITVVWAAFPILPLLDVAGRKIGAFFARIFALAALWYVAQLAYDRSLEGFGEMGFILFFILVGSLLGRVLLAAMETDLSKRFPNLPSTDRPMLLMHFGFVLVAWSCQLSLGYTTPILGVAGLGLVFHELLPRERFPIVDVVPVLAAATVVAVSFWKANYEYPYRDLGRPSLTMDLGEVFPKLSGIRTNPVTFARYVELKNLITTYALKEHRSFAVLQDYPGAHWLMDQRNPISLDWCLLEELATFESQLWEELQKTNPIAIVPKDAHIPWLADDPEPACDAVDYTAHNALSRAVAHHWHLLGSGTYFCVFSQ